MIRTAITGGIACGKSTVLAMFAELPDVEVLSADAIVHQLYEPGEPVYEKVVAEFGRGILAAGPPDSAHIDRKKLADQAFRSPERRKKLESIVHPAVIAYEVEWMAGREKAGGTLLAIIEVPLLFEAKSEAKFAKTIAVACAPEKRLERYRARHPELTEEQARHELARRSASQLPDAEKSKRADFVIDNSGTLAATRSQVRKLYEQLTD
jgi:dephospho-CoA kinase